jgi:hypothetical protein
VKPLSKSSTTIVILVGVDEPKGVGVKVGVGAGVRVGVGVRVRVGVEVGVGVRVGGEVGVGVGVGVLVGVGVGGAGEMGKFGNSERSMKYAIPAILPQTTIQTTTPTTATRTRVFPLRGISSIFWRLWGRIELSMPSGILPTQAQITVIGPNKKRRMTKTTARSSRVSFIDVTCLVHD